MRTFDTGATRDANEHKPQYDKFLSPIVLHEFAEYMQRKRIQTNGEPRPGDNWQKGIPLDAYMESLMRHVVDLWLHHRGHSSYAEESLNDTLAALLFNVQGYYHEKIKEWDDARADRDQGQGEVGVGGHGCPGDL